MDTPAPVASGLDATTTGQIRSHIKETKGWMKLLGILSIIGGALQALTIVGIVVAWLPIWLGIILTQAAGKGNDFVERGNPADLVEYHSKVKTYFTILGILAIIALVGAGISLIIGLIVLLVGGIAALSF